MNTTFEAKSDKHSYRSNIAPRASTSTDQQQGKAMALRSCTCTISYPYSALKLSANNRELKAAMTATPTKTPLENVSLHYLSCFRIIQTRSTCTIWVNYPGTKLVGTAFK